MVLSGGFHMEYFKSINMEQNRRTVNFLHIGKTGGTSLKTALRPYVSFGHYNISLHKHGFRLRQLPPGELAVFFLRNPVTRFVSGFNSRLRRGMPRYFVPWTVREKTAFKQFSTANQLALALSATNDDERTAAEYAMHSIAHVKDVYARWFDSEDYFLSRLSDTFFIGFQESLSTDFEKLKLKLGLPSHIQLPCGEIETHKTPASFDQSLEPQAKENLINWYQDDMRFFKLCKQLVADKRIL